MNKEVGTVVKWAGGFIGNFPRYQVYPVQSTALQYLSHGSRQAEFGDSND